MLLYECDSVEDSWIIEIMNFFNLLLFIDELLTREGAQLAPDFLISSDFEYLRITGCYGRWHRCLESGYSGVL